PWRNTIADSVSGLAANALDPEGPSLNNTSC
ncbi:hypothetical protein A2U01_0107158, partial [Trifolium medium]|nr:hypothetical protein [Trifolium medium]